MAKKGRRATNEERLAAIQMYDNGLSADRIAEIMGVSRSSVFDWIANYREGGLAAISTKFASGRPTALADSEMIQLFTMINGKDPRAYSFGVALWTRSLIRDLIKKKFSKDVSEPVGKWSCRLLILLFQCRRDDAGLAPSGMGRCTGSGAV
jgi:transposase